MVVVLDGNQWGIELRECNGAVGVSLTLNGVPVVSNARAAAGAPIITSRYSEAGNFTILCQNFAIPDYTQFGVSQFLVYLSPAELAAYRVPPPPIIPASFFNPISALPLRFAPQGYTLA